MNDPIQLFAGFIAVGLVLIAVEIFVPGGVLGTIGALALMVAIVMGFFAFGPQGGFLAAVCIVIASAVFLALWIRIFPRTKVGKVLTLKREGSDFKSADPTPSPSSEKKVSH